MSQYAEMIRKLRTPEVMERLETLYGKREGTLVNQTARYNSLIKRHESLFNSNGRVMLVSAPGRAEIGGNHTDHNGGKVLTAAINLDTLSAVSPRDDLIVNLHSEGYPAIHIDLSDLSPKESEQGTTAALVRGVAAEMAARGYKIGGFDAATTSSVASGSGLSSSAAFEVMTCAIFDALYNGFSIDTKIRAIISKFAENEYFGKPSGLLDQISSSTGGLVAVDFKNDDPDVKQVSFNFGENGYAMIVVATGGSHANLTDQYAAIPAEMKQVADQFGESCLRRVRKEEFTSNIPKLRGKVSDRAIMRAMHFYEENERVVRQVAALQSNNLPAFFKEIISSGRSSFMYLQNVYATWEDQSLSLALALAEEMLGDKGAWRIHGGGFAGTTLNFVPQADVESFVGTMEAVFGTGCCNVLDIRPEGAAVIEC